MKGFRFFAFRADPATGTAIEAAAAAAKTSLSSWIRNAIRAALPEGASLPALPPSPLRRRAAVPEADVAALARLMAAVNRLNGAMIQLSKGLREAGHVPEHQSMESAIRDVRDIKAEGVRLFKCLQAPEVSRG
ncbi:hypothetical protein [Tardiphaga robiniae]|uniref:Bacterial mobilisation domain-containing protein n=1 Tax=Tardiphaga robiniae TaxID=943830 RepID=A0A120MG54_9BRAD|nr:hypothetical protein [Tardiphaga robiniae]AMH39531.1 hypothetical protein PROKKA_00720 [Tardiphaga robiniae]KZD25503.1 hypothetical protein A4A58_03565 [Tardiphaga robiniae]